MARTDTPPPGIAPWSASPSPDGAAPGPEPSLRLRAAAGARSTTLSQGATVALQFLQVAVLSRILPAEDFGLMALASVVLGLGMSYADLGLGGALIHRQDTDDRRLSTLYWTNVAAGVAVTLAVLLLRPALASMMNEPRLAGLLGWLAPAFAVAALGQLYQITLQKSLRFERIALIDTAAAAAGAAVAIGAALLEVGVLSLVWGLLATVATRTTLLLATGLPRWRPALHWAASDLRGYLSFGLYQVGERTVNALAANLDYLIIGRFLGVAVLGPYSLAFQLIVVPVTKINPIVTRVAFPVFSRCQDDLARLRRGYLELSKLLLTVTAPLLVGAAVTAPALVPVVFGPQWESAVPFVRILALVGLLRCIGNPSGVILQAKGRTDIGFLWNCIVGAVNAAAFLAAVQLGAVAVAWTYLALALAYSVALQAVVGSLIALGQLQYWRNLLRPTAAAAGMGAVVLALGALLDRSSLAVWAQLATLVAAGAGAYGLLLVLLEPDFLRRSWRAAVARTAEAG